MAMNDYYSDDDRLNDDAPELCDKCPYNSPNPEEGCAFVDGCFCWGCEYADDDSGACNYPELGCARWKED